jgi:hypothetical protein
MFPGLLETLTTLGGMVIPPVLDLVRKKIIGRDAETPEATLATLATSKPEVIPAYVDALAKLEEARTRYFQRDVVGNASPWVTDLRAAIRPIITALALVALIVGYFGFFVLDEATRATFCFIVGSWFGTSTNFQIGSKK